MHRFAARRLPARSTWLGGWLVRCASWLVPLCVLIDHDLAAAKTSALFMGIGDGLIRLMSSRTARALVAEPEGLLISSGFDTSRIPWADVLAAQTWSLPVWVDYVAVHYRTAEGGHVAICTEQFDHAELVAFVRACASHVNREAPRQEITLFGLQDRAVWWPILRRALQDVAVAAFFALWLPPALLLGAIAVSTSASIAVFRYSFCTRSYVLKDAAWYLDTKRGPKLRSRVPRSLWMWVEALAR